MLKKPIPAMSYKQAVERSQAKPSTDLFFPAVKDGKYGFIDLTGSFVIPPIFTAAQNFSEGMAAVFIGGRSFIESYTGEDGRTARYISSEKGKWGYIDRTGEIKIPPQFGGAHKFSEGLALVTLEDTGPSREEFLEVAGPYNPGASQEELTDFWEEEYNQDKKYGYIDAHGLFKITPKFAAGVSSPFKHGIAVVGLAVIEKLRVVKGRFVDGSGNEISVNEAVSKMREESKERWIDTSGNEIDSIKALGIVGVNRIAFKQKKNIKIHGRAFVVEQYGLKDDKGKIVVEAKFEYLSDFYDEFHGKANAVTMACIASAWKTMGDVVALSAAQRCGVIDVDGNFVVPPDFDRINLWSENLASFTIGCKNPRECPLGKQGIYSIRERKIIVNPQFDDLRSPSDGLILGKIDGKWGYFDTSGKAVIPPQFSSAGRFQEGLAQVDLCDYIDRTGKYVYKCSVGALTTKPAKVPTPHNRNEAAAPTRTGTGFIVSRQGHILTNHHVIDNCRTVRATIEGGTKELIVVATDSQNDLAVLKLPGPLPTVARFREGRTIRPGDSVVVVGFPLHGLLASEANVTTGTVSALAGLRNDTRFLQITAPVQPGNSGGPLLDQSGQIVGIVVSKLNAVTLAKATGDIPQNINFAINAVVAKSFLDSQSVEYETGTSSKKMEPAEIGAAAKKFTLLVECYR